MDFAGVLWVYASFNWIGSLQRPTAIPIRTRDELATVPPYLCKLEQIKETTTIRSSVVMRSAGHHIYRRSSSRTRTALCL